MSCFGYDLIPVVLQGGIFSTVWNVLASSLIGDLLTDHWLPSVEEHFSTFDNIVVHQKDMGTYIKRNRPNL